MRPLIFTNLSSQVSVDELDELLRVFRPYKLEIVDNVKGRKAHAFFLDNGQAKECAQIIGLRPDLVQRRLGEGATVSVAKTDITPQPLGHAAAVMSYGGQQSEGDDFVALRTSETSCNAYRVACTPGDACLSCDGEIGDCLVRPMRDLL